MPDLELKTKTPTWLKIAVVVLIGISIFYRWVSLDKKIYCCDENWTSVAISGHTLVELQKELSEHEGIIPINNFQKYQHISPEKHVIAIICVISWNFGMNMKFNWQVMEKKES